MTPARCRPELSAVLHAAATWSLPATTGTSLARGEFLNAATAREPVCVLGAAGAQLPGIDKVFHGERIWVAGTGANGNGNGNGGMWLYAVGIINPDVLASASRDLSPVFTARFSAHRARAYKTPE